MDGEATEEEGDQGDESQGSVDEPQCHQAQEDTSSDDDDEEAAESEMSEMPDTGEPLAEKSKLDLIQENWGIDP